MSVEPGQWRPECPVMKMLRSQTYVAPTLMDDLPDSLRVARELIRFGHGSFTKNDYALLVRWTVDATNLLAKDPV